MLWSVDVVLQRFSSPKSLIACMTILGENIMYDRDGYKLSLQWWTSYSYSWELKSSSYMDRILSWSEHKFIN